MPALRHPGRILMTTDAVGGVFEYAVNAGAELGRRGSRVHLLGFGPAPSPSQHRAAQAAGLTLSWSEAPLDWTLAGLDELAPAIAALEDAIQRIRPDVLHLNAPPLAGPLPCALPCVVAAHSCLASWWASVQATPLPSRWRWHREAMRAGLARADVVLAPSDAFAGLMRALYGPLPHLAIVHNAVAPIAPKAKGRYVLAAGRWWDEGKNLDILDAAAARIRWPVRIAGPLAGPGGQTRRPRHVGWLGNLAHGALARAMAHAPIFVAPSRFEPFGLAVLEAASAGAALVLSDIATFRELWNGDALRVDPSDAEGLACAINHLAEDAALRARLAEAAVIRAQTFSMTRQVNGLLAAYARAADAHRAAS